MLGGGGDKDRHANKWAASSPKMGTLQPHLTSFSQLGINIRAVERFR